ncbi:MAG: chemotaxis-specific protein-glutamate methyltransferase CheB [Oscillatoriaceae bacterium SKW80]|nr:chemotaxis-specific protein-glutamate methyltransferase CheB [Oscillatoriaceae bacterium SKYG93]MCX8121222.1 chemotaxis-specific protein-glutamate methyltransferase CheB [Oscillatoriaceae bacterium SKW80]MDW8453444.1 chemotaxis-specific protein-glutamate methyltransferase CheB [Oscillatoriaceae cyanobacterium SKYGB_i_bin93]HIK26799.1 chemotaxis-specific protein-glutamate methyltransferase CheB [Oscillatoriaceae cyanobacterium M7585_C2015_266]
MKSSSPIRVLLVEDSPVALIILKRMLSSSPEIVVVGEARTGKEALALIPQLQPQVICTDLHMPQMDGLEFTQEVMAKFPRPILVISSSVQAENTQNVFRLLQAGAVDVFPKPRGAIFANYESIRQELINKIKILSGVTVFTLRRKKTPPLPNQTLSAPKATLEKSSSQWRKSRLVPDKEKNILLTINNEKTNLLQFHPKELARDSIFSSTCLEKKVLAIGASTGGPQALHTILSQLPSDFPVPILCVQHISEGFLQGLVDWLASESPLQVKIAGAGELPKPGTVYFPPEGVHLELDFQGRFKYSSAPPIAGHRPSVTVMFNSVARYYGKAAIGVLLTGMGRDGAEGLQAIAAAGGLTIAQDEKTCIVFGMPKEAIALGAVHHVLPIHEIASVLIAKLGLKKV